MSDFPNAGKGKKDAIFLGINSAMHDYIITTDADCTMQANWLNTMCNYFISARPALLAGPVTVSYTHLRAHETVLDIVCRLLLEKKNT